jgi:hypothetical protein
MHFSLAGVASAPNTTPLTVYSWEGYSDEIGTPVQAYTTVPTLAAGVTLYSDASLTSYYFNTVTDTFVYGGYVYPDAGDNQTIKGEYLKLNNPWATTYLCYSSEFGPSYYVGGNAQYFNGSKAFLTWYEDPFFYVPFGTFFYDPGSVGYATVRVDIVDNYGNATETICEPPP